MKRFIVLLITLSVVLLVVAGCGSSGTDSKSLKPGDIAVITSAAPMITTSVTMGATYSALNEFYHDVDIKDTFGILNLADLLYEEPLNTKVLILDVPDKYVYRIRVLEGQDTGKAGFIYHFDCRKTAIPQTFYGTGNVQPLLFSTTAPKWSIEYSYYPDYTGMPASSIGTPEDVSFSFVVRNSNDPNGPIVSSFDSGNRTTLFEKGSTNVNAPIGEYTIEVAATKSTDWAVTIK